jgi:hypothetical protein
MTKVTLRYDLMRPLTDADAEAISKAHSVYGIARVAIPPSMDCMTVDYDASRLSEKDVESWLIQVGIPLRREPIPAA